MKIIWTVLKVEIFAEIGFFLIGKYWIFGISFIGNGRHVNSCKFFQHFWMDIAIEIDFLHGSMGVGNISFFFFLTAVEMQVRTVVMSAVFAF